MSSLSKFEQMGAERGEGGGPMAMTMAEQRQP